MWGSFVFAACNACRGHRLTYTHSRHGKLTVNNRELTDGALLDDRPGQKPDNSRKGQHAW